MTVEIAIPEKVRRSLGENESEISRQIYERLIADLYRTGELSHVDVRELMGLDRWETDGFLKKHDASRPGEEEEYADDLANLLKVAKP